MINYLKYRTFYFVSSVIIILIGLFTVIRFGFIYSIDFTGGTNLEYKTSKTVSQTQVDKILKKNAVPTLSIRISGDDVSIRSKPIDEKKEIKLRIDLQKNLKTKIDLLRFETVGPVIGKETVRKTAAASVIGVFAILLYMSFAFRGFNFALAAIIALIHDLLVVVGTYSVFSYFLGAEVDTLFVTALLTSMVFSAHDTIIIFDKIREYKRSEGRGNPEDQANRALNQTMIRSINNSMTIIFVLLALSLLGGSTIRFFILALLVGTITGTYSSPFIATPVWVWLERRRK